MCGQRGKALCPPNRSNSDHATEIGTRKIETDPATEIETQNKTETEHPIV